MNNAKTPLIESVDSVLCHRILVPYTAHTTSIRQLDANTDNNWQYEIDNPTRVNVYAGRKTMPNSITNVTQQ